MNAETIKAAIAEAKQAGCRKVSVRPNGGIDFHFRIVAVSKREFDVQRFKDELATVLRAEGGMPSAEKTVVFVPTEWIRRAWLASTGEVEASLKRVGREMQIAIRDRVVSGIVYRKTTKRRGWMLNAEFFRRF